ncbi:hypothetical protein R2083_08305 [Nitrosomonas sp. Is35]|uniref:hypothetical protein n=1 Tax=Nitrosomonas sp. Is35 TaxID=3080534 RepID=UPI00294B7A8E|nr:hypothetical protein [Nitrosomonas sp. Is35]MDV6347515.1 hypothetical protein [Nitrosomonas sp. Is35]
MSEQKDFRHITAETAGKDLLGALVTELKLLPDVWQKLSKAKQDDVIDRLRNRVEENVKMVVFTIASQNRTTVAGSLDKVTIKGNVEAVIKFGINAGNLPELFAAAADQDSRTVLVVVADPAAHTQGMDEVKGEDDQRTMDLGHEYHDNDGGGMDGVSDVDPDTGEMKGLPSPDQVLPSEEELGKAFDDGYQAAAEGKPQTDYCPIIRSELVVEWVRGWKAWHEENVNEAEVA